MWAVRPVAFALIVLCAGGCARQASTVDASMPARPGFASGLAPTTPAGTRLAGLLTPPTGTGGFASNFFARSPARGSMIAAAGPAASSLPGPSVMAADLGPEGPFAAPSMAPVMVASAAQDAPYRLGPGDRLRIMVFGQEGLSNTYMVDAAGNVALPLIGAVRASGQTDRELSAAIAARLRNGFIRDPQVAVELEAYRPFYILGEVTAPGQYPYVPNMTMETAVAIAGGFTPRASHQRVLLTRPINGQPMRFAGPFAMPVRPGDTITIEERWF
jgi:polysaccharide export outer membrane protein